MPATRTGIAALLAFILSLAFVVIPGGITAHAAELNTPAPGTITRTALTSGHSDTVSSFVDDGKFVLGSKADLNGVTGQRINADRTVFHLGNGAKQSTPTNVPFLRGYDSNAWIATETQQQDVLWPGFSTEHDPLVAASENGKVSLELVRTDGPGRVEIFTSSGFGSFNRLFSSSEKLPAWSMGMRQHTHAFWAFSKPGRYALTFRGSTVIGGKTVSDEQTYNFHIGPFDTLTTETAIDVSANTGTLKAGEPLQLTTKVQPANARGAVEYVDISTGQVLGHSVVKNGRANLETTGLAPGAHRIIARFVPTYNDEFAAVAIADRNALPITVTGDVAPKPSASDTKPLTDAQIGAQPEGQGVTVTSDQVVGGMPVVANVRDGKLAGGWVSVWWHGDGAPKWGGWQQVSFDGFVTATAPGKAGQVRLAVKSEDGALVGWDRVKVTAKGGDDFVHPGGGSGSGSGKGDANGGSGVAGPPRAEAARSCAPGLVLETGHIDAFNVSASSRGAVLQLKEDVTGSHVVHEAEDVLLRVKPSAKMAIPGGFPGAPGGFVLPVTQDSNLIWPGWDTNGTATSGYTDTRIHIESVDGPGAVHVYTIANFGSAQPLLDGGRTQLPGSIHVPKPAHVHAQWVFAQAGIYKLRVSATVTNPATGDSRQTAAHTYVFQVGDVPLGNALCDVAASADAAAAAANVRTDVAEAEAKAAEQARAEHNGKKKPKQATENGVTVVGTGANAADADAAAADEQAMLVGGLIGGGSVAVLGGVGGLAWWYVRRMGALAAAAEAGIGGPGVD
ncbi:choice-of-anchor M domain-containing protein [Gulosibacter bifidus]|uniref:Choice-of-anchor M domain-containing protein n=1 Tax=Gulosibacter bifidus TaxID=272239 RepID=A0ABW5RKT9_9MICO|nr:choice-of-anchor M domain-containing protein [Gulosibacter bifidus]